MAYRRAAWAGLAGLGADVVLVQEAGAPGPEWALRVVPTLPGLGDRFARGRPRWRTTVVGLTDRVKVRPRPAVTLEAATSHED